MTDKQIQEFYGHIGRLCEKYGIPGFVAVYINDKKLEYFKVHSYEITPNSEWCDDIIATLINQCEGRPVPDNPDFKVLSQSKNKQQ